MHKKYIIIDIVKHIVPIFIKKLCFVDFMNFRKVPMINEIMANENKPTGKSTVNMILTNISTSDIILLPYF